jgi:hypothetical protein
VADVGEEESLGDGDVGDVLVVGGVGGALVGVPHAAHVGIAASLLVIPLLFSPLALLGTGFVILPLPLLEDLAKAFDD